jgi:hypothetical protein
MLVPMGGFSVWPPGSNRQSLLIIGDRLSYPDYAVGSRYSLQFPFIPRGVSSRGRSVTAIYCDEAGNTGANLLDPEQPIFVLASNNYSEAEADDLLQHVRSAQGAEPKFATLRRRPDGIARIVRFLSDARITKDRVRISVFHKRYLVVTKMVDLVAETLIHQIGGNLYERGANIAMANLLFFCMPAFCGEKATNTFLQRFVDLIRDGPDDFKDPFYAAGDDMIRSCLNEGFKSDLIYFTEPTLFESWYDDFDGSSLDPAIPALFQIMADWGGRIPGRFDVLHDRSKPILTSQATFEALMAEVDETSALIGTDRRKVMFPLRASSLTQVDSKDHPQLQVADICAGAINHFYKLHLKDETDELASAVDRLGCLEWGSNFILPQPYVTPNQLGTDLVEGADSVDSITKYLLDKAVRKIAQ